MTVDNIKEKETPQRVRGKLLFNTLPDLFRHPLFNLSMVTCFEISNKAIVVFNHQVKIKPAKYPEALSLAIIGFKKFFY